MKYSMRYYTTVAILLLCLMSAMSCSTEKSLAFIEKPIEFVDAETSFCDTTYLDDMKMVRLENNGSQSAINNISRIIEIDDQLYIFDRTLNQITVFDNTGRFVRSINKMGHGKGEYVRLIDVTRNCCVLPNQVRSFIIRQMAIMSGLRNSMTTIQTFVAMNHTSIFIIPLMLMPRLQNSPCHAKASGMA